MTSLRARDCQVAKRVNNEGSLFSELRKGVLHVQVYFSEQRQPRILSFETYSCCFICTRAFIVRNTTNILANNDANGVSFSIVK